MDIYYAILLAIVAGCGVALAVGLVLIFWVAIVGPEIAEAWRSRRSTNRSGKGEE